MESPALWGVSVWGVLVVLVIVQKAGDLLPQPGGVIGRLRRSLLENLALDICRKFVPATDYRRSETVQDLALVFAEVAAWTSRDPWQRLRTTFSLTTIKGGGRSPFGICTVFGHVDILPTS